MKPEESWLRARQAPARPWLLASVVLGWASVAVLALQAWLLAQIIDALALRDRPFAEQHLRLAWLLALIPARALLVWAGEQAAEQGAAAVRRGLRRELFDHARALGPAWQRGRTGGAMATLLVDGVEAVGAYTARYLPVAGRMAAVPPTLLLVVAPFDGLSALVLLVTAPLVPFFMILIGKGAERRNRRQWRQLARLGAHLLDVARGLPTLRLYGAAVRQAETVERLSEEYRLRTLSVLRLAFLSSFTLEFFATVSIALVAVLIGFRLYWGELEFLHGLFVLLLAPEFYLPLRALGAAYHDRMEALGAAERLVAFFGSKPPARGRRPFRPRSPSGIELRLEAVRFRWPDGRGGLEIDDLTLPAGARIAVVGPSGAGKSTLVRLLLGFLEPDRGRILADGQPLSELDPETWRRHLAWVPQNPRLFRGTLAENIALGRSRPDPEALREAARQARCLDFIESLPEGFGTRVGEGRRPLSGGQRQRVALARVFFRGARLVLLDEPTASLDLASEQRIQEAVDRLAGRATLVTVAHRLPSIEKADLVLVLEGGRLVQQGRHHRLAEEPGPYRRLLEGAT